MEQSEYASLNNLQSVLEKEQEEEDNSYEEDTQKRKPSHKKLNLGK